MALLELKDVQTFYGNIQALKGISISVEEGEIVTLIGANGAGKTTTLMSICGITPIRSGQIVLKGQEISKLSPNRIVKMGVSQVPEGRRIFPQLSVSENLDMGAFLRTDKEGIKRDMEEVFAIFPRLAERRSQLGGTLSGGEQQMLAVSRALMANPHLLLLDEPSLGLAPLVVQNIFEVIEKINKERKTTILLVEQNANMALKIANKGYVMQNGAIKIADTAAHLLENEEVRKAYLGL
jgi:branched-chain amino acid transport system ATP-binding protein